MTQTNEIIVQSMAKGLDRHHVRQNIAYLVLKRVTPTRRRRSTTTTTTTTTTWT